MQVDPEALRAWAKWLDGLSGDIKGLANDFASAATNDPFPGTDLAAGVSAACDQVRSSLRSFSSRPAEMAQIAKGVGDKYEIQDTEFAYQLRAMGGLQ